MRGLGDHPSIGERIAFYRKRRGQTLAGLVGLSTDWLAKIETGRRNPPRIDMLTELARDLRAPRGPARTDRAHGRRAATGRCPRRAGRSHEPASLDRLVESAQASSLRRHPAGKLYISTWPCSSAFAARMKVTSSASN
ncbi:helix-turn-helix domain-containing protein [Streptomyces cylindrosporus]|uniref:Helix-turn-helix domain-containing protein n=1 Tax=Streptomyces cylindrosporus TaxID=2927583 RepID=A0ABS9Y798_9ACTN|nr:helix-turn-helix domain-containing protein [Streptomyces cylindrosporus]MCI3273102.1 helix-turn-helix domain-containing protein [Streptomyces cylindrosporus]